MKFKISITILLLLIIGSMAISLFKLDPNSINLNSRLSGPSLTHLFGTDNVGRDLFARVFAGASNTILFSFAAAFFSLAMGIIFGLAALWTKQSSAVINFLNEIIMLVPDVLLIFLLASFSGGGLIALLAIISIANLPYYVKIIQSSGNKFRADSNFLTLKALGIPNSTIITKHLLPLVWPLLAVQTFYNMGSVVLILTTLGFLGVGLEASMLENGET